MLNLIRKYTGKLEEQGLSDRGSPLMAGLDAGFTWNTRPGLRVPCSMALACFTLSSDSSNSSFFMAPIGSSVDGPPSVRLHLCRNSSSLHDSS